MSGDGVAPVIDLGRLEFYQPHTIKLSDGDATGHVVQASWQKKGPGGHPSPSDLVVGWYPASNDY
jgi:hypothetical protein